MLRWFSSVLERFPEKRHLSTHSRTMCRCPSVWIVSMYLTMLGWLSFLSKSISPCVLDAAAVEKRNQTRHLPLRHRCNHRCRWFRIHRQTARAAVESKPPAHPPSPHTHGQLRRVGGAWRELTCGHAHRRGLGVERRSAQTRSANKTTHVPRHHNNKQSLSGAGPIPRVRT